MRNTLNLPIVLMCLFLFASCASQKQVDVLQQQVDQLKAAAASNHELDLLRSDVAELKVLQKSIKEILENSKPRPARTRGNRPGRPDDSTVYAYPIGAAQTHGSANAWVTIVEISDFQCPFCKRVGPVLERIQKKFGTDVRFVFKHNPLSFHRRARPAAIAAECAGKQKQFWAMHKLLFKNQRALEVEDLMAYAKKIPNLNTQTWQACVKAGTPAQKIDADQKQAESFGARGTPAFFINGRFLSGAQPFEKFDSLIREELKKAKASGISPEEYYQKAVVAKGKPKA